MHCPKCRVEVKAAVKFCHECGYAIAVNRFDEKAISRLSGQKALKVIGWVFVPFVMIFVSWKSLRNVGRFYGVIWAVLVVLFAIGRLNSTPPTDKQLSAAPVSAVMEQKPSVNSDVKAEANAKSKAVVQEDKAPHIGEAAEVGKLNVAVWKGPLTGPSVGDGILKHDAKGTYWLIRVGVGNRDKESRTIDSNMFKLVGPDGTMYDPDTTAGRYANDKTHFFLEKINPGIDIEGFVVFDMPTSIGIDKTDEFILRVDSGIGFKGGSHVDFVLKKRTQLV